MENLIEELKNNYKKKYNQVSEQLKTLIVAQHQLEGAMMAMQELGEKIESENNHHKKNTPKIKRGVNK